MSSDSEGPPEIGDEIDGLLKDVATPTPRRSKTRAVTPEPAVDLTSETFAAAKRNIIRFAEDLSYINGDPVDYSDDSPYRFWREPLEAVVDPDTPRIHEWLMARGLGKTEQSTYPELYIPGTNPMSDAMRALPRAGQLNSYMARTLSRKVETSPGEPPVLKRLLKDDSVAVKRNSFINHSILEGRSAWGDGEGLQGFHGVYSTLDEIQQWSTGAIANAKEATDSGMRRILMTGTPGYEGTIYEQHWNESDKREWFYDCADCGHPQIVGMGNVRLVQTEPKSWGFACVNCGEEIAKEDALLEGYWKATNPTGVHRGYHMTQLLSPRHELDEIMRDKALPSTSRADFERYKLAHFYSGGAKPISQASVSAVLDDTLALSDHKQIDRPHVMGVDWGGGEGSDTIVVVATVHGYTTDGYPKRLVVRGLGRIDYETRAEELRKVAAIASAFEIPSEGRMVADMGYGSSHVSAMQNGDLNENAISEVGWGSQVIGHHFGNVSKDTGERWDYLKQDKRVVTAYQPPWANRVIELFPDQPGYDEPEDPEDMEGDWQNQRTISKGIVIPYADDVATREAVEWFSDHLTAIKREYSESRNGKKREEFTSFGGAKDDGFFALTYAYTAACLKPSTGGFRLHNYTGGTR